MPSRCPAASKLPVLRVLLLAAVPLACAVGVTPDMEDNGGADGGSSPGGSLNVSGSVATTAGRATTGGSVSAFGGTSSTAGKAGSSSTSAGNGGSASGGKGGAATGGSGSGGSTSGSGGSVSGGSGGSGPGGTGGAAPSCACPKTLTWMDNTVLNWGTGDCLDVAGTKYLYTGAKMQTYANAQCNPTKQEAWCTDSGNDYKFMACK